MTKETITRIVRGFFFFSGFCLAKVKYLPLATISPLFLIVASICNFLGHGLEYLGSLMEPGHTPQKFKWYGFMQFKDQYALAANTGILASILGIAAVFFLPLVLVSTWLFLVCNIVKAVAEYHKLNNNPNAAKDVNADARQKALLNYALTNCVLSIVSAVAVTLMFVFPPLTFAILIATAVVGIVVGAVAFKYWLTSYNLPYNQITSEYSYQRINDELSNDSDKTNRNEYDLTHSASSEPNNIYYPPPIPVWNFGQTTLKIIDEDYTPDKNYSLATNARMI